MKKVMMLLLTTIIVLANNMAVFATCSKHENSKNVNCIDKDDIINISTSSIIQDDIDSNTNTHNIIVGDGTHIQDYNTYLNNNYATYYFSQLKNNMGENQIGTCSYVAMSMLLSYYDTYWNDNVIPENYEQNQINFNASLDISYNTESPGIKSEKIYVDYMSYDEYTNFAENETNKNNYFHIKLLDIGTKTLGKPYGVGAAGINDILQYYLYTIQGFTSSELEIEYIPTVTFKNKRQYIIDKVKDGIPIIVCALNLDSEPGHTYIIYDYNEEEDELYCHAGWSHDEYIDQNSNTTSIYDYSHIPFSHMKDTLLCGLISIDIKSGHSHSDNYVDSDGNTYCSCYFSCHDEHECIYYNQYNEEYHTYACDCNPIEENLFEHSWVYEDSNFGLHSIYCGDCGYSVESQYHTYEYTSINETYHRGICIYCGNQTYQQMHDFEEYCHCYEKCTMCEYIQQVIPHDYTYRYGTNENDTTDTHYAYCECNARIESPHSFVTIGMIDACEFCAYQKGHQHSYTYTPCGDGETHRKSCACGNTQYQQCFGMTMPGQLSRCSMCGQRLNGGLITPLGEEDAVLPSNKEDDPEEETE